MGIAILIKNSAHRLWDPAPLPHAARHVDTEARLYVRRKQADPAATDGGGI